MEGEWDNSAYHPVIISPIALLDQPLTVTIY